MRDFVDTLPLRLAAGVGALVGVIGMVRGVDLWVSAGRVGAAFLVVLLGTLGVRHVVIALLENVRLRAQPPEPADADNVGVSKEEPPAPPVPAATASGANSQDMM